MGYKFIDMIGLILLAISVIFAVFYYLTSRRFKYQYTLSKSTLDAAHNGILVVNSQNKIVEFNQKFLTLWNFTTSELKRKNDQYIFEHIAKAIVDSQEILNIFKELQSNPDKPTRCVLNLNNGKIIEFYSHPQKYLNEKIGQIYHFEEITHLKAAEQKLIHNATHDNLTKLANRILLFDHIEKEIARSKRSAAIFALLFVDLDSFKMVNDTLGHMAGDKVLRKVAKRLLSYTRSEDTLARVGGDEFVLLALDLKSKAEAAIIANKYLQVLSTPFFVEDNKVNIKCSIGVSSYPGDGENARQLVQNADVAMYMAKKQNSRIQFYTETMQNEIADRIHLENDLTQAIGNNQLVLYFQPIVNLRTKNICATEALVRWNHPTRGLLSPAEFINVSEENGSIDLIGKWVLENACLQNKRWHDSGLHPYVISVNISSKQLEKNNFVNEVATILAHTELEPQFLQLELTESRLIDNLESTSQVLTNLKMLGVKIAIDDFGAGYTGLSFLRYFPIDKIKIDKSLIHDIPGNSVEEAIISAMIKLTENLGMSICVEGIENEAQFNHLLQLGCREGQGYLFSAPINLEKYSKFISKFDKTS
jgi:diguanylate cyclase (GGDEF)-like protein